VKPVRNNIVFTVIGTPKRQYRCWHFFLFHRCKLLFFGGWALRTLTRCAGVCSYISTFVFPLVYFPQNDAAERAFPSLKCVWQATSCERRTEFELIWCKHGDRWATNNNLMPPLRLICEMPRRLRVRSVALTHSSRSLWRAQIVWSILNISGPRPTGFRLRQIKHCAWAEWQSLCTQSQPSVIFIVERFCFYWSRRARPS
jgi:hypothetical protein